MARTEHSPSPMTVGRNSAKITIQDKDRLTRYPDNWDLMRVNHSRLEEEHLARYLF
jgi:hypothetical protein